MEAFGMPFEEIERLGQPEIAQRALARERVEEEIGRLDVSVDHVSVVTIGECLEEASHVRSDKG
jgi:hypothetical protein